MQRKGILLFLLIGSFTWATAQDTDHGKVWTLRECIDYALGNNLDIQRSSLDAQTSQVNFNQSKYSLLPSLNANSSYGTRLGRSIDPTTNTFVTQTINSFNLSGSSSVTLWNGFRLVNGVRSYSRQSDAAEKDLEKARNDVALNVASLYLTVLLDKEQLNNAQSQLATTQQQLERTQKLLAAGSVPQSDVLTLEAQDATNELTVTQGQNAVDFALLQLKQALQLPASTRFDIENPEIDIASELAITESSDEIYSIALEAMPEVQAARLRVESSDFDLKSARGELYPTLGLSANVYSNYSSAANGPHFVPDGGPSSTLAVPIGYVGATNQTVFEDQSIPSGEVKNSYPVSDQLNDNISKAYSFGLSIPIFNGMASRSSVQRASISSQRAKINETQVENTLRENVETAYNNAMAASKTYLSTQKQVQARDEAFRMTKQRYEIGAATSVEYQISQNDLFQAQSDFVRAKYDFIFKKKVLDFYEGKEIKL